MNFKITGALGIAIVAIGGYAFVSQKKDDKNEIEYRYAPVAKTELVRSISATGAVVALTTVDVKSKAGGNVVKLFVAEGSIVKKGDPIATIDPSDTQALYEQANADLSSANARATQAQQSYRLQIAQSNAEIADAKAALAVAQVRLARASIQNQRQPELSRTSVASAQAAYDSAVANLQKLDNVTIPQMRRDARGNLSQASAQRDAAVADLQRQQGLLQKGYVAGSAVDRALAASEAAKAAYDTAQQHVTTLEAEIRADRDGAQLEVHRSRAVLEQAKAQGSDVAVSQTNYDEALKAVEQAQIALQKAKDDRLQIDVKHGDILASKAETVHNKVSLANAKVQLDSTSVVAPRDGVVTLKYLEEGTIIPPGTSTFAQGTSLVQLSDVTQLYVECAVDEADVANVKVGQKVRTTTEAYPGEVVDGLVTRVNPAAITDQNVTSVKVRVQIFPKGTKLHILPGMNATCEFITMSKKDALVAPAQAVNYDGPNPTVRVKTKDPLRPEVRTVEIGETGNDGVEIKTGVKEGEEVVTAEINLAELAATQKAMQEAEQGSGGLAGGGPSGGKRTSPGAWKGKAPPKKK